MVRPPHRSLRTPPWSACIFSYNKLSKWVLYTVVLPTDLRAAQPWTAIAGRNAEFPRCYTFARRVAVRHRIILTRGVNGAQTRCPGAAVHRRRRRRRRHARRGAARLRQRAGPSSARLRRRVGACVERARGLALRLRLRGI